MKTKKHAEKLLEKRSEASTQKPVLHEVEDPRDDAKARDDVKGAYGFNDPELHFAEKTAWTTKKKIALVLAIVLIIGVWLALDQKLLFGKAWLSPTYDNPDWRTNEGNLHTFGAWDLETHIWKTEYIMANFPNFHWNPYWYLGMPLIKYYQSGFYWLHWLTITLSGLSAPRSALLMLIFGHLLVTFLTFFVCYKVSRKIWASALSALFLLSNTYISLRSYGWEPITVVFLFLYPLGLYLFFKEPLKPFRLPLVLLLGIAYLAHPLIWFSLCMIMAIYLVSIALRKDSTKSAKHKHYIIQLLIVILCSLLIGAVQFIPQITYKQATSGAHMGVSYLPFYQVPPNIISIVDFLFDAGNLKGPGPIVMIALLFLVVFGVMQYVAKKKQWALWKKLHQHELITGLALTIVIMVLFYYMELYNIFPMNFLRTIQYHRVIPEFIITSAILVAALSNIAQSRIQKIFYYSMLITFIIASGIIIYDVQGHWLTSDSISSSPEFIYDSFQGRGSVPYTDQSFTVRNSFTNMSQVYGYYEQGITNTYDDEIFSVSSGYQNANMTVLYFKAANVARLYVNLQEGARDQIVMQRLNGTLPLIYTDNPRYAYFQVDLANPSSSQAVDANMADDVQKAYPGCRVLFQSTYCGSVGEEFIPTDPAGVKYVEAYVKLLEQPYSATSDMVMIDPDHYNISVSNATAATAIVVKMTYDSDFSATSNGKRLKITQFGPDFMLIYPAQAGDYNIALTYNVSKTVFAGLIISILTVISLIGYFILYGSRSEDSFNVKFPKGDMA